MPAHRRTISRHSPPELPLIEPEIYDSIYPSLYLYIYLFIYLSIRIYICIFGAALTAQRIVAAGWRFAQQIVVLADELIVVQHVQLLPGTQLLAANAACEAIQMEHLIAWLPHQIRWCNALATAAALCAITSRGRKDEER